MAKNSVLYEMVENNEGEKERVEVLRGKRRENVGKEGETST